MAEVIWPRPRALRQEPAGRPPSMAQTLEQLARREIEEDVPYLVASLQHDLGGDRAEVSKAEYQRFRAATYGRPEQRAKWLAQVGPEAFIHEVFELFGVDREIAKAYLDLILLGIPHEQAVQLLQPPPPVGLELTLGDVLGSMGSAAPPGLAPPLAPGAAAPARGV